MKNTVLFNIIYCTLTVFFFNKLLANNTLDSISYEKQRSIVNNLLNERVKKFGEFDQSLGQKTGFFGLLKSKNDMQKSIDILQNIVKMDNKIFIETRNLLKIKDYQAEKYQLLAEEYDNQVSAYMRTVSKLQVTNEKLKKQLDDSKKASNSSQKFLFIVGVIILTLLIIIIKQYKQLKFQKLTKL